MFENQEFLPGMRPEDTIDQSAAVFLIKIEKNIPYFLVAERLNRKGSTLPGGKLRVGESPENGAIREAYEETGIKILSNELLITAYLGQGGVSIYDNGLRFFTHIFFAYFDEATNGDEPVNIESKNHGVWEWTLLSELPNMISAEELPRGAMQDFMMEEIREVIELYPQLIK